MGANIETGGFLDLKKQFTFYASHHNNPVNIFIHLICIWNILWSALAMFHMLGPLAPAPSFLAGIPLLGGIPITLATLTTAVYVVCYILMEPFAGGIGALLVLALNQWTYQLVQASAPVAGFPLWQAVLSFHIVAWILQFIGHGIEGRSPALLDSWQQAFITAPLFVLLEIFCYFGYRKHFYNECMKQVEENIAEFQKPKKS